jgi:hypothetical protein
MLRVYCTTIYNFTLNLNYGYLITDLKYNTYLTYDMIYNPVNNYICFSNEPLKLYFKFVRFQVLTAASTKMTVSWGVALCSLAETDRRFIGA